MKTCVTVTLFVFVFGIVLGSSSAHATNSYEYKPGETLVIVHGLSPDKQYSISAGANAKGDFHLYLVDARSKKRIGPLDEMTDMLDTGADSLYAAWAPDSRHVAITYRISHQENAMYLYRIENRRAFLVSGPRDLASGIKGMKPGDLPDPYTNFFDVKWVNAARFTLNQECQYNHVGAKPSPALKAYTSDLEEQEGDDTAKGQKQYGFGFAADGDCELTSGDKYRLVSVRPEANADR